MQFGAAVVSSYPPSDLLRDPREQVFATNQRATGQVGLDLTAA